MKKLSVKLNKNSYPVWIGASIFSDIKEKIYELNLYRKIFVVVDQNVEKIYGKYIKETFKNFKGEFNIYVLSSGEKTKSYIQLNKIYEALLQQKYGRDTLLIAIGGGVTGDLAGYAASTFMRGIQLAHVPTTLLASVDSSIGGKTGINFGNKKNMIGTFYQPKFVLIDINFINSLPKVEITSGMGEIIKYAYLTDRSFYKYVYDNWNKLFEGNNKVTEKLIQQSAAIKTAVVSQDERESSLRKILNFGHTFAHAYESELDFKIKHGVAVVAGIISALVLSNKVGLLSNKRLTELLELPLKFKLPKRLIELNQDNLIKSMYADKKNRGGKIKFVLISDIGNTFIDVEAKRKDIFYTFNKTNEILSV